MLHGHHYQNAYVTRDIDKAVARFAAEAGRQDIVRFAAPFEVTTPRGRGVAELKLALVWIDALQYEFIEPVGGLDHLYREALPEGDAVRFHHIAARVDDWERFRAQVDRERLIVAMEGGNEGLKFLYLDRRDLLGHYVEYVWAAPERWRRMGAPWATPA